MTSPVFRAGGILLGLVLTVVGIEAGARAGVLEIGAPFLAAALIGFYRLLGPRGEQLGWATFLFLLGLTYLGPGMGGSLPLELGALVACAGLAIAGVRVSPWFLAAAFALHVPWDFLPREIPDPFRGLPVACLSFDGLVAVYIGWQARIGRWSGATPVVREEGAAGSR